MASRERGDVSGWGMRKDEGKQDVVIGPSMEVKVTAADTSIMRRMRALNENRGSQTDNVVKCD
jgi:hypothetical protein